MLKIGQETPKKLIFKCQIGLQVNKYMRQQLLN